MSLQSFYCQIIVERNAGQKSIEKKLTAVDLVTESDKEIEQLLTNGLLAEFPHHKWVFIVLPFCDCAK